MCSRVFLRFALHAAERLARVVGPVLAGAEQRLRGDQSLCYRSESGLVVGHYLDAGCG
jgi:hypothetical protein